MPTDKIFEPGPDRIFVFGSNLGGMHGAGAARTAYRHYGAVWGKSTGLHGASYAIPTKDDRLQTLSLELVKGYVDEFISFAKLHKELYFFVTRIGCGLAGYTDSDIAPMFENAPSNCELPDGWRGEAISTGGPHGQAFNALSN